MGTVTLTLTDASGNTTSLALPYTVTPTPGPFLKRWSAAHMANDQVMTLLQAVAVAKAFDLVVVHHPTFVPFLAAMRAANPGIIITPYANAAFSTGAVGSYPLALYSRSAAGAVCTSKSWGNPHMDVGNSVWVAIAAALGQVLDSAANYDGVYFDMLTTGPMLPGYLSDVPINPRTGLAWTTPDYITALVGIANAARAANPGSLTGNVLGSGNKYFNTDGTSVLPILQAVDVGHCEDFLRSANDTPNAWPTEAQWKNSVDMLVDVGRRGLRAMTQTKVWVTATQAQFDAWHALAAATFMMGTDGNSYFTFSAARTMAEATRDSPYDTMDIGTPLSRYRLASGGVWRRDFTRGIVLVNTGTPTTAGLAGTYVDAVGTVYTGSIPLATNQGVILGATP